MSNSPTTVSLSASAPFNRIIVIGSGGAGKSTLARKLGEVLDLPVHHLDALFWRPGWVESTREELRQKQEVICAQPKWVIDGNYGGTLDVRLASVDVVIFLDLPRTLCVFRAIKRSLLSYGKTRPDMAPDCPERFNREFLTFLKWIWDYRQRSRPVVLERLATIHANRPRDIVTLRSRREVADFLTSLAHARQGEARHLTTSGKHESPSLVSPSR